MKTLLFSLLVTLGLAERGFANNCDSYVFLYDKFIVDRDEDQSYHLVQVEKMPHAINLHRDQDLKNLNISCLGNVFGRCDEDIRVDVESDIGKKASFSTEFLTHSKTEKKLKLKSFALHKVIPEQHFKKTRVQFHVIRKGVSLCTRSLYVSL